MEPAWYSIKAQPRHEELAAAHLRRHLKLEVFSPRVRYQRKTGRGKSWVTEPLFPGYLFASFDLKACLAQVRYGPGVQDVLHFRHFYPRIPVSVIEELRKATGTEDLKQFDSVLEEGREVELIDGPLAGFQGVVRQILPAKLRIKILLDFLGQATVVEVQSGQVLPRQKNPFRT